ncbi:adenylyltransferase/cytidyltransferase family protein [Candidatus Gracilibacteria bacterium]|nr:adenylyltransferase/cytidyltransferase family protein [Candidatus Gracilibacteria bacterium]
MSFTQSSHSGSKNQEKNLNKPIPERLFDLVMCFGTFDIFHPGHVFYLSEAEKLAKKMIIVIARDARVEKIKGRYPKDTELIRQQNVRNSFCGAEVILGNENDIFAPIRAHRPSILAFGYDQRVPEEKILESFPQIKIVRIEGYETDKWKSSLLRKTESE